MVKNHLSCIAVHRNTHGDMYTHNDTTNKRHINSNKIKNTSSLACELPWSEPLCTVTLLALSVTWTSQRTPSYTGTQRRRSSPTTTFHQPPHGVKNENGGSGVEGMAGTDTISKRSDLGHLANNSKSGEGWGGRSG